MRAKYLFCNVFSAPKVLIFFYTMCHYCARLPNVRKSSIRSDRPMPLNQTDAASPPLTKPLPSNHTTSTIHPLFSYSQPLSNPPLNHIRLALRVPHDAFHGRLVMEFVLDDYDFCVWVDGLDGGVGGDEGGEKGIGGESGMRRRKGAIR